MVTFKSKYTIDPRFGIMRACEDPDPDEPDEKFIAKFNKVFHKAMSEREKRDAPKRAKEIADALAGNNTTLLEDMKKLIGGTGEGGDKGDKGKPGDKKAEASEEVKALQAKMAKMEKERDEEKAKRTEAETKALRTEESRYLNTLLTENKVRPTLLSMATRDLHGRYLVRDEEGSIKWKKEDGELVDPKVGWGEFAKTDEGKELLSPKDGGGGAGSGRAAAAGAKGSGQEFGFADLGSRLMPKT